MPIYDFTHKECGNDWHQLMSFSEYDEFESVECPHCGGTITKEDRIMGKGLRTNVVGVSKGNYNGRDFT